MAINNSPVINDDSTEEEESVEKKEGEIDDYLDELEKETSRNDEGEINDYLDQPLQKVSELSGKVHIMQLDHIRFAKSSFYF